MSGKKDLITMYHEMDVKNKEANENAAQDYLRIETSEEALQAKIPINKP